jgi:hypothetical protein
MTGRRIGRARNSRLAPIPLTAEGDASP